MADRGYIAKQLGQQLRKLFDWPLITKLRANMKNQRLLVPTSKTDQEGRGAVLYLKPGTLHAIRHYQSRAGFMDGPLFRQMQKGDRIDPLRRLTADGARLVIKAAARAANIVGASGHSFRIGTAQSLAEKGAGLVDLQNAGRYMPAHYTRGQAAGKGAVARLLKDV